MHLDLKHMERERLERRRMLGEYFDANWGLPSPAPFEAWVKKWKAENAPLGEIAERRKEADHAEA